MAWGASSSGALGVGEPNPVSAIRPEASEEIRVNPEVGVASILKGAEEGADHQVAGAGPAAWAGTSPAALEGEAGAASAASFPWSEVVEVQAEVVVACPGAAFPAA